MRTVLASLCQILVLRLLSAATLRNLDTGDGMKNVNKALNAVIEAAAKFQPFVVLITDSNSEFDGVDNVEAPWGIGMFEVASDSMRDNMTKTELSWLARDVQQKSKFMTVVIVSDDPAFLAAFTEWSFKNRLLVWSTRLLVLTHLPLHRLHHIQNTLAMTNSMLLQIIHNPSLRYDVYVQMPYSSLDAKPLLVASWTEQGNTRFISGIQFFPEKFVTLSEGPELVVVRLFLPPCTRVVDDPHVPGGKRIVDPRGSLLDAIAKAMNFTIKYVQPADGKFGAPEPDGSWSGMVGMIHRKEVDLGQGIFIFTPDRATVMDFPFPVSVGQNRMIVSRGRPEVDPWSFMLPFMPLVWFVILTALLVLLIVMVLMHTYLPPRTPCQIKLLSNTFSCIRVLLQQDVLAVEELWWWERVVFGVWMLAMVVLTRSYNGTLMSILAVRYIPLPIQSLQDVVDKPFTIIMPRGAAHTVAFLKLDIGKSLDKMGKLKQLPSKDLVNNLDTLVRRGDHIYISPDTIIRMVMAEDFSKRGSCDFYLANEMVIPWMGSIGAPKGSPLIPALSRRTLQIAEAHLYQQWTKFHTSNMTKCLNLPKKVAVKSSLGIKNIWGMLVVLAGGAITSLMIFWMELLCPRLH